MLEINEIFESISGEAGLFPQGSWCTFVRFQGCNLKCPYCDTKEAQSMDGGMQMSVVDVFDQIRTEKVIITGGEPLLQDDLNSLVRSLNNMKHKVQVETNGFVKIPYELYLLADCFVIDFKLGKAGGSFIPDPFDRLYNLMNVVLPRRHHLKKCVFKFVVSNYDDILEAADIMNRISYDSEQKGWFIVSPINGDVYAFPRILEVLKSKSADFACIMDRLILSVQLHKLVNMK